MNDVDQAIAWARARAAGPQRVPPSTPSGVGMRRLVETEAGATWLLPMLPEGAGPTVLEELGLSATAVEQPNDTARVLAACLRCCWSEPNGSPWPGVVASWEQVTSVFRGITDNRDERYSNIALVAGVRRLAGAGWLRWSEATREVQLGPRVALWRDPELSTLRELWRLIPSIDIAPNLTAGPDLAIGPDLAANPDLAAEPDLDTEPDLAANSELGTTGGSDE
ncbi:MAG TPA: hypothetical protein VLL08_19330 [Kineosporiaceae bacterium]|nr:hypothetical protein [Kineosporiaceae bacterium]